MRFGGKFVPFCESTSLHGWNHLPSTPNLLSFFYWSLVVIFSFCFGGFLVYTSVNEFLDAKTDTKISTTTGSLEKAVFPNILICNAYNVRKSFIDVLLNITANNSPWETVPLKKAFI